jgi:DUF3071 family protein
MIKLHLVGFTTDLKNLIFARREGAKTGAYLVEIDSRLRRTLEEVALLEEEPEAPLEPVIADGSDAGRRSSKLPPKEIQSLLRRGKTAQEVARMAETDESWIERFTYPIIEERSRVVDAVKSALLTKARLGKSAMPVGEALVANLRERRVSLPQEILDESWSARLKDGRWEVTFTYLSRGQGKDVAFSFDPETRQVEATNSLARELAWWPSEDLPKNSSRPPVRNTNSRPAAAKSKSPRAAKPKTQGSGRRRRPRSTR